MQYQWYPGHMTKAKRMMQENIQLIDLIIELVDARVPQSSRNPDIDQMGRQKSRLILLNKADLADPSANKRWEAYWKSKGYEVIPIDARKNNDMKQIQASVAEVCQEKIERDRKRGILNRPVRAMVVGIPNVGKSTFINSFAKKSCTKTGNKPGVTKGKQWIRLNKTMELLDTPGILWPKFEDPHTGKVLAMIGSINDEILQMEELALELIAYLEEAYPGLLKSKYEWTEEMLEHTEDISPSLSVLLAIAKRRGCIKKGGEADTDKAARLLIDDFRSGKIGRITLELPDERSE